ncbi:sulfite exporter TauE/SafE family protein [Promicromonospora soli]|uniref:sulfite exporter TauE/SafE family protein n=1 Tax=Promicromonospora soli TaxID=2035533 RepID=UPI00167B6E26
MVGFAKTAVGGVGSLAVVLFAVVLPARESTGALLPLLIAGDLVAVALYRRHGSARELVRLLPGVVPGLLLGAWFVARVDNTTMTLAIGAVLVVMGAVQIGLRLTRRHQDLREPPTVHPVWTAAIGAVAGFATMTANAAGPVMALYLVMAGLPMLQMLGTGAWFFLVVNLLKVPLSTSLDLISWSSLLLDACLVPAMLLGAFVGARLVRRWRQRQFELATLAMSIVAAGLLIASA